MNFRVTAILFGIVFAIGVVLLILTMDDEKKTPTDVLAQELAAAGAKTADVDSIEFSRADGGTLLIVRTDKERNTWQIQKPLTAKADAAKVLKIIDSLLRAKPTPYSELTSNPAAHGLEPSSLKVVLRQGNDRSSTINLGDVTLGEKGVVFVTTSTQSKRPMAVRRGELEALFREPDKDGKAGDLAKWTADFRTPAVFPADSRAMGEDVTAVKLSLPNKKQELALARTDGVWKFTAPAGWGDADTEGESNGSPLVFTGVAPILRALANVSALSPGDFIDNPKDLAEYGLNADNPDRIRVEMQAKEGVAVVYFGKWEAGAAPPPMPGSPHQVSPPAKVYVSIEGQPGVIRASAANLSGLAAVIADPNPLRDRDLLRAERNKTVDGIDILLAGQAPDKPTKLRRFGDLWMLYGGPNDPQFARDVSNIAEVVSAKRSIKDFPASNPALNFAAVPVTLYVWVDGFNLPTDPKAEPTRKGEPTKLEFGRREGDVIHVRRTRPGGQVSEFTLPAARKSAAGIDTELLSILTKTRLDLLDKSLPSFNEAGRFTATGAGSYVVARDAKPAPGSPDLLWRFVAPDPRAGQVANGKTVREVLIYRLANLSSQVDRFVDETPTPEKLAEYGLAQPLLKVTVDLPPEAIGSKPITFEFGKPAADPEKVYARVSDRAAVFTVPKAVFTELATPDLRDRTAARFDPAKATVVEIRGWEHLKLGEQKLRFERNKDGAWVGTVGEDRKPFASEPAKVEQFLKALSQAEAKVFLPSTSQKPEYGFGDANHLIITVTLPGSTLSMNIGAPADGVASYYLYASTLPAAEPFCTVDAGPLKSFKESPAGFAK